MELTIKDRFFIPALFPEKGTFAIFDIKESIKEKIFISEDEKKKINFRENEETKSLEWDMDKETLLQVDFTTEELKYLKECCETTRKNNLELPDEMWRSISRIYNFIDANTPDK